MEQEDESSSALSSLRGDKQKTRNDDDNQTTLLIAKKAGKFIAPGETVTLQVPLGVIKSETWKCSASH